MTLSPQDRVKFHQSLGANMPLAPCVAFHSLIAKRPGYNNGLSAVYNHYLAQRYYGIPFTDQC